MRLLIATTAQLAFWGLFMYVILCLFTGCERPQKNQISFFNDNTDSEFQKYAASHEYHHNRVQNYALCLTEVMTGSKVVCGDRPGMFLQMPATVVPPPVALGCASPLAIGDFGKLAVEHVKGCLPLGPGDVATLVLDGPGATVNDLFRLLTYLHEYRQQGHKVICIVDTEALSGNAYAFESPECDTRIMRPEAHIGIHHVVVSIEDAPINVVKEYIEKAAQRQRFLYHMVALRIDGGKGADTTVDSLEAEVEASVNGLLLLDSGQAIAIGLADKVVPK